MEHDFWWEKLPVEIQEDLIQRQEDYRQAHSNVQAEKHTTPSHTPRLKSKHANTPSLSQTPSHGKTSTPCLPPVTSPATPATLHLSRLMKDIQAETPCTPTAAYRLPITPLQSLAASIRPSAHLDRHWSRGLETPSATTGKTPSTVVKSGCEPPPNSPMDFIDSKGQDEGGANKMQVMLKLMHEKAALKRSPSDSSDRVTEQDAALSREHKSTGGLSYSEEQGWMEGVNWTGLLQAYALEDHDVCDKEERMDDDADNDVEEHTEVETDLEHEVADEGSQFDDFETSMMEDCVHAITQCFRHPSGDQVIMEQKTGDETGAQSTLMVDEFKLPSSESTKRSRSPPNADIELPVKAVRSEPLEPDGKDFPVAFQTASGRQLKQPSSAAITRAKMMLSPAKAANDVAEKEDDDPFGFCVGGEAPGSFQTAGGKCLKPPSSEAIQRATAMFASEAEDAGKMQGSEAIELMGFQTASGLAIKQPSKDALRRASAMFGDDVAQSEMAADVIPLGFQTASGKAVKQPSSDALRRASAIFGDDSNVADKTIVAPLSFGFQTAGGKAVKPPSKDALRRASAIFGDEHDVADKAAPAPVSFGLKTAGGKAVKPPSKDALRRASALFGDDNEAAQSKSSTTTLIAEQTAEGNSDAVGRTPAMLSKECNQVEESPLIPSLRFQTAGGKSMKPPSTEALRRASAIFGDENSSRSKDVNLSLGFQSASGKSIQQPSSEALRKAAALFQDDVSPNKAAKPPMDFGFQSAGGQKLEKSSEEALQRVAALFKDGAYPVEVHGKPSKSMGFQSASGEKLARPSATALHRAAALFGHETPAPVTSKSTKPLVIKHDSAGKITEPSPFPNPSMTPRAKLPQSYSFVTPSNARMTNKSVIGNENQPPSNQLFKTPAVSRTAKKKDRRSSAKFRTPFVREAADDNQTHNDRKTLKKYVGANKLDTVTLSTLLYLGVPVEITSASFESALSITFPFNGQQWGPSEAHADLLTSSANGNLIDERWVRHHFQLIVWKVAGYIRICPSIFWLEENGRRWSRDEVFQQLCYRYEREINEGHRSPIKAICERDDVPTRGMVLAVCNVPNTKMDAAIKITLSDGWYNVPALLDEPLTAAFCKGHIFVGQKLYIYGAQMAGQSDACPPLDLGSEAYLTLSANSTRRVKWHTKLGFLRKQILPLSLRAISPKGGLVPYVTLCVCRIYSVVHVETLGENNKKISRSPAAEALAQDRYFCERDKLFEKVVSEDSELKNPSGLVNMDAVRDRACKVVELPPRSVTSYLKFIAHDAQDSAREVVVTLWRPDMHVLSTLKENHWFHFFALTAGRFEKTSNLVRLSSTKQTKFIESKLARPSLESKRVRFWEELDMVADHSKNDDLDLVGLIIGMPDDQSFFFVCDAEGYMVVVKQLEHEKISTEKIGSIVFLRDVKLCEVDPKHNLPAVTLLTESSIRWNCSDPDAVQMLHRIESWVKESPGDLACIKDNVATLMGKNCG